MPEDDEEAVKADRAVLAENVIRARRKAGLTQSGLAKLAGVKQQQISVVEQGTENVTLLMITRLAKALGTETDALIRRPRKK